MSKKPNASIASIGAVYFRNDEIIDKFYCTVDLKSCKIAGLDVEQDTINWWMTQSKEARDALRVGNISLVEALEQFSDWFPDKNAWVWGNGSSFDNVIMESAYAATGMTPPWKWWNNRCYRTLKSIIDIPEADREGTYHNALDDAMHQTKHLIKILNS